jgi:hypothetical protein
LKKSPRRSCGGLLACASTSPGRLAARRLRTGEAIQDASKDFGRGAQILGSEFGAERIGPGGLPASSFAR